MKHSLDIITVINNDNLMALDEFRKFDEFADEQ